MSSNKIKLSLKYIESVCYSGWVLCNACGTNPASHTLPYGACLFGPGTVYDRPQTPDYDWPQIRIMLKALEKEGQ